MIGGLVVGLFVLIFFWQLYSLNKEEIEYKITDSESIENKISQNKDLNIYFFFKKGCQPCNVQKKKKDLNKVIKDKNLLVYGVDIEEKNKESNFLLLDQLNITQTPTVIIIKEGKVYKRLEGVSSYELLEESLIKE
jgi:thioredoxin 1